MRAIAGRCIAAMAMVMPLGVWQHFLPRSEAPGPPCCLTVMVMFSTRGPSPSLRRGGPRVHARGGSVASLCVFSQRIAVTISSLDDPTVLRADPIHLADAK